MRIGVVADTHIPTSSDKLPQKVYDYFQDCDLIIHAGDAIDISVIKDLEKLAETKAVCGNMDNYTMKNTMPEKILMEVEGKKIGVVHGKGSGTKVIQTLRSFFTKKPDIIIFGHSHTPCNEKRDGILFFNPGSPTDRVFSPYRSFGIIDIDGDNIKAEIIRIDD